MLPLILGIVSMIIGVIALALAGAPRLLLAGIGITAVGLLAGAAVSRFWKMSGHTTAAAAVLVICAAVGHGWPLLAAPLIALVGWARVRLGDHTVAQVVVGALVGAIIATLMIEY
jgi:membrane-associated phospholipid phosphatase